MRFKHQLTYYTPDNSMLRNSILGITVAACFYASAAMAQDTATATDTAATEAPAMEKADGVETEAEAAKADAPTVDNQKAEEAATEKEESMSSHNAEEGAMEEPMADPVSHREAEMMQDMMDMPTDETHAGVFKTLRTRLPGMPIQSIADAAFPGLYEVVIGSSIIYVDETVSLLFQGELIDLEQGVNLTESRLTGIRMALISDLSDDKMLIYPSKTDSKRHITVFTDINCGYCRKLHSEIDTLLENGVAVRYLMFPRAGLDSESRIALDSVWCADNPQEAMTSAKAGEPIVRMDCDTPVEEHYALAEQVGLRGTPLIFLDNGLSIPGYRQANEIVEMINSADPL